MGLSMGLGAFAGFHSSFCSITEYPPPCVEQAL